MPVQGEGVPALSCCGINVATDEVFGLLDPLRPRLCVTRAILSAGVDSARSCDRTSRPYGEGIVERVRSNVRGSLCFDPEPGLIPSALQSCGLAVFFCCCSRGTVPAYESPPARPGTTAAVAILHGGICYRGLDSG